MCYGAPTHTPPIDLPTLAVVIDASGNVLSSSEIGNTYRPRESNATLSHILDHSLDLLERDGSVSIVFPTYPK